MSQIVSLFQAAVYFGTVILFGAVGEILAEKSGNLNLGVPGIMYMGGIAGLIAAFLYENGTANPVPAVAILVTLAAAFVMSMIGGLIYSVLTITLRANQNVTGLTLTIFGSGFANLFGGNLNKMAGGAGQISVAFTSGVYRTKIPFLSDSTGVFGEMFFFYGFLAYVAIIVALAVKWFLNRTSVGLNLRAVGENPATADAAGINVTTYRYLATIIGSVIAGLGGIAYIFYSSNFSVDSANAAVDASGWLSIALVIFTMWKPTLSILGAFVFSLLSTMGTYIPGLGAVKNIIEMSPYVITIVVLIITSIVGNKEIQPPASLGLNYFREDR